VQPVAPSSPTELVDQCERVPLQLRLHLAAAGDYAPEIGRTHSNGLARNLNDHFLIRSRIA
jgi:hypothetical protein